MSVAKSDVPPERVREYKNFDEVLCEYVSLIVAPGGNIINLFRSKAVVMFADSILYSCLSGFTSFFIQKNQQRSFQHFRSSEKQDEKVWYIRLLEPERRISSDGLRSLGEEVACKIEIAIIYRPVYLHPIICSE